MLSVILLGGFLGAGKTTTMIAAAKRLEARGRRVAIITNDQGDSLVDSRAVEQQAAVADEVAGGCFCCRFEDFAATIRRVAGGGVDTVIAEAVGSCTDLQATVVRPLRRHYADRLAVAPLTVVVDPARLDALADSLTAADAPDDDLAYLFERQLQEADVIALNKCDTRSAATVALMARLLDEAVPEAVVVPYSARDGAGLDDLVATWQRPSPPERDLDVDYPRYARAEAALGWLNTDLVLEGTAGFDASAWARSMLADLSREAGRRSYVVGHVKLAIDTPAGLLTASLVAAGGHPEVAQPAAVTTEHAAATLNARVACEPDELDALARHAVARADSDTGALSRFDAAAAFAPSFPRPTHRLEAV